MIRRAKTVNSAEGIASEINAILARMADRYYLTFPGYDEKPSLGLPWDSKDHDLVLKIDKDDTDPVTLHAGAEVGARPRRAASRGSRS